MFDMYHCEWDMDLDSTEEKIRDQLALLGQDLKRDRDIKKEFFGIKVKKAVDKGKIPHNVHSGISRLALKHVEPIAFRKKPSLKEN